jgi:hypothetical protein
MKANFTFIINDGFCAYEYPLPLSNKNSISHIVKKIYKAFKIKEENGELIKPIIEENNKKESLWQPRPYKCPVCGAKGVVPKGFYSKSFLIPAINHNDETCNTCKGTGIVWSIGCC